MILMYGLRSHDQANSFILQPTIIAMDIISYLFEQFAMSSTCLYYSLQNSVVLHRIPCHFTILPIAMSYEKANYKIGSQPMNLIYAPIASSNNALC